MALQQHLREPWATIQRRHITVRSISSELMSHGRVKVVVKLRAVNDGFVWTDTRCIERDVCHAMTVTEPGHRPFVTFEV